MADNEGPKRTDFQEASKLPACGEHCEIDHGDQADPEQLELMHLRAEVKRLGALLNNPATKDFLSAVELEAAHQRDRWKTDDALKSDADWYWTVGYLAGKALHLPEKRLHHVITAAAALYNWHHYSRPHEEPGAA